MERRGENHHVHRTKTQQISGMIPRERERDGKLPFPVRPFLPSNSGSDGTFSAIGVNVDFLLEAIFSLSRIFDLRESELEALP
jgi:hypothetical protein